ncbi:Hsp20/alpha crystallin family protein [Candidatus Phytoplasma oryzae]|nr:Hsp20/alpha crystallin family protein [Candidatus Phytoplasma oryzae]
MFLDFINSKNSLFDHFLDDFKKNSFLPGNYINNPMPTDIIEKKDHYLFIVNVPGLTKEEIKIFLDKNILTIETCPSFLNKEKNNEKDLENNNKEEEKVHYLRQERTQEIVKRTFKLNNNLNSDNIQASVSNGLLQIIINKVKEEIQPKKYIDIK